MNLDLRKYSTFNIGGIAHKVFKINDKEDIKKVIAYSDYIKKPLIFIGEGSNSIFSEDIDKFVIGLIQTKGIEITSQNGTDVYIKAQAGEKWDDVVKWSVKHNLSGIEALSGIPGTVGAAPIQNIGAYGTDISKTFFEAEVFDRENNIFKTFSLDDCMFDYRDSIFKKEKNKFVIVSVTLKLSTNPPLIPQYKDVIEFFKTKLNPTPKEIRKTIIKIRNSKIPNYKKIPNCGSFFKNPFVTKKHLSNIQKTFPNIPFFEISANNFKLFAGWLIENVNYKLAETKTIVFNEANKLVLINKDNGNFEDLMKVINGIKRLVEKAYNLELEIEPNIFE